MKIQVIYMSVILSEKYYKLKNESLRKLFIIHHSPFTIHYSPQPKVALNNPNLATNIRRVNKKMNTKMQIKKLCYNII